MKPLSTHVLELDPISFDVANHLERGVIGIMFNIETKKEIQTINFCMQPDMAKALADAVIRQLKRLEERKQ